ncbi:MAG TPA: heme o synthase [Actinomycetota bacterium]|nr:heme o synthase [Actinomycetota bacterium]
MTRFQKLAIATTVTTLTLIVWGGVVRTTGSGDGCPDWPTCFGSWVPRWEYHTLIEYVHRLLGVVSGLLAVALAVVGVVELVRARRGRPSSAPRGAVWMAVALVPLFGVQGALGGAVVNSALDPAVVTLHFGLAMIVLGVLVAATTLAFEGDERAGDRGYARVAVVAATATFALLLVGTYVRAEGAGLAFRDWPLMDGRLVPPFGTRGAAEMFAHRVLAILVAALVLWLTVRARTMRERSDRLVRLSTLAGLLFVGQIAVGGINVLTELSTWSRALHVAMSAAIWATVVAIAVVARREPVKAELVGADELGAPEVTEPASLGDTVTAYVRLTKPRIIVLLLITTVPAMVLAERGFPSPWLVLATLVGGSLAAGAANAINMYLDRDIDEVMRRTRSRPLPAHQVPAERALAFGFWLGAFSFLFLGVTVNVLAATLSLAAIAFYVVVYTMWLKRSTTQNIVIGGAAGAAPALIGWAAVTGSLALPAWILFAIVFVWTPPHFWALALRFSGDYAAAGVPMLPVVKGDDETRRQIFLYSLVLFGTTLLLAPAAGLGPIYLATAVVLGGVFVYRALALWRSASADRSWRLFSYSIVYLAALFGAVALDAVV